MNKKIKVEMIKYLISFVELQEENIQNIGQTTTNDYINQEANLASCCCKGVTTNRLRLRYWTLYDGPRPRVMEMVKSLPKTT